MPAEDIRTHIINSLFNYPELGKNYIDWHLVNSDVCGVTVMYKHRGEAYDIFIKPRELKGENVYFMCKEHFLQKDESKGE